MTTGLSVRKLSVTTSEGKPLLRSTSIEVLPGRVLGIYGPNGSGKTSFMKAISGISPHDTSGEVWVGQNAIRGDMNAKLRARELIYLGSDYVCPFEMTVRDLLHLGVDFSSEPMNIPQVAEEFDLLPLQSRLISTLSDGERQWVMLARAIIQNPHWLVLDESLSKVDLDRSIHADSIFKKWVKGRRGIVISSHDINVLSELSDVLLVLNEGEILDQGEPGSVLQPDLLARLFPRALSGRPVQIVSSPVSGKPKIVL